jgi:NADPH2:quinone reductase
VWCFGAQTYRPFSTAAEFTGVPRERVVPLPEGVSFDQAGVNAIAGVEIMHVLSS